MELGESPAVHANDTNTRPGKEQHVRTEFDHEPQADPLVASLYGLLQAAGIPTHLVNST